MNLDRRFMFKKLIRLVVVLLGTVSGAAQAELEITVTGGDISAIPIALVPFAQIPEVQLDIAQVVENDLVRSGRFKALPRGDMLQRPIAPAQIDAGTWRAQGIDNVVVGQVAKNDSGGYYARFFLVDAVNGQQVLGFDIPARSVDQMRYVAHQIADLIYEKLLGSIGMDRAPDALYDLQETLELSTVPRVIVCFDISHTQGTETVASAESL